MPESAVRPLDFRDLAALHRVRPRGLCLHAEVAYTRGPQTLQTALLDMLTPGRPTHTLVAPAENGGEVGAIGQILQRESSAPARLVFFGPAEALAQPSGLRLLDALSQAAGQRGAHNLIADVDEHSPAFECLRTAGFAIYARQRIWRREPGDRPGSRRAGSLWRPESGSDAAAIQALMANLIPGLVQQVETSPTRWRRGFVYRDDEELRGYLDVERGPLGIWLQPYLHPAVETIDPLLAAMVRDFDTHGRPLFVCARSYQGWMSGPLTRFGFEPVSDQAVMVRRLAAAVRVEERVRRPALEVTPEPTAPIARTENSGPWPVAGGQQTNRDARLTTDHSPLATDL
ncbi:MAG TPA: hypothetical protein VFI11_04495 [Anaerolineales bacterium]|nr:hypothetical protein [Anaerolineales bacterium]